MWMNNDNAIITTGSSYYIRRKKNWKTNNMNQTKQNLKNKNLLIQTHIMSLGIYHMRERPFNK